MEKVQRVTSSDAYQLLIVTIADDFTFKNPSGPLKWRLLSLVRKSFVLPRQLESRACPSW